MLSLTKPSLRSSKQTILAENNNFIESLLLIFVNDKIDSDLFLFKLEKLSYSLFEIYLS